MGTKRPGRGRENIEDLYAGIEFDLGTPDSSRCADGHAKAAHTKIREDCGDRDQVLQSLMGSTPDREVRVRLRGGRTAAQSHAVHKSNILNSRTLFLAHAREVAQQYPRLSSRIAAS